MSREISNAKIDGALITNDEHGCLSAWIYLDYGDGDHQGFGGWALYLPKSFTYHEIKSYAGHFIYRVMEVAEVDEWSKLIGKCVRVDHEHDKIHRIGHITKNNWFAPQAELGSDSK